MSDAAAAIATEDGAVQPTDEAAPPPQSDLLFRVGLIADVQYADKDDGHNYLKTKTRYYRGGYGGLRRAVEEWLRLRACENDRCPFVVMQLGDLIDGFTRTCGAGPDAALSMLLKEFDRLQCDVHHLIGNHELYCFSKSQLVTKLPCPSTRHATASGQFYYQFSPHPRFVFVVLDTYEVSLLGSTEGSPERQAAEAFMANNPNDDKNSPMNLEGYDMRFVAFNGGVSQAQLAWLRGVLAHAQRERQHVLIFTHVPIYPCRWYPDCLSWNYDEVLECLYAHRHVVVATFAGHAHTPTAQWDERGRMWHYVLQAPLEVPPGTDAHATIEVYADRLIVQGAGTNHSITVSITEGRRDADGVR